MMIRTSSLVSSALKGNYTILLSLMTIQNKKTPHWNFTLETLCPLILLQHKAFTQHIKDLGDINLTLTKTLDKRKDSYISLKHSNKIPRSLRVKYTLSTSQAYAKDSDFLELKEKFDNTVGTFI
jgi:hypothetical protein